MQLKMQRAADIIRIKIDITLVIYNFYPVTAVLVAGTAAIVCSLILFVVSAYIRQHNSSRAGEEK